LSQTTTQYTRSFPDVTGGPPLGAHGNPTRPPTRVCTQGLGTHGVRFDGFDVCRVERPRPARGGRGTAGASASCYGGARAASGWPPSATRRSWWSPLISAAQLSVLALASPVACPLWRSLRSLSSLG